MTPRRAHSNQFDPSRRLGDLMPAATASLVLLTDLWRRGAPSPPRPRPVGVFDEIFVISTCVWSGSACGCMLVHVMTVCCVCVFSMRVRGYVCVCLFFVLVPIVLHRFVELRYP